MCASASAQSDLLCCRGCRLSAEGDLSENVEIKSVTFSGNIVKVSVAPVWINLQLFVYKMYSSSDIEQTEAYSFSESETPYMPVTDFTASIPPCASRLVFKGSDINSGKQICEVLIKDINQPSLGHYCEAPPITCDAGGPYTDLPCSQETVSLKLNGERSRGQGLKYTWSSNCLESSFDDSHSSSPIISLNRTAPLDLDKRYPSCDPYMTSAVFCDVKLKIERLQENSGKTLEASCTSPVIPNKCTVRTSWYKRIPECIFKSLGSFVMPPNMG